MSRFTIVAVLAIGGVMALFCTDAEARGFRRRSQPSSHCCLTVCCVPARAGCWYACICGYWTEVDPTTAAHLGAQGYKTTYDANCSLQGKPCYRPSVAVYAASGCWYACICGYWTEV